MLSLIFSYAINHLEHAVPSSLGKSEDCSRNLVVYLLILLYSVKISQ